jgi:hypothetical protein
MRRRAYELAETGQYKHWSKFAATLLAEGFLVSLIAQSDRDGLVVMMITRCWEQARA